MSDDFSAPERGYTAWELDHLRDARDNCDAYALLDDVPVLLAERCTVCGSAECRHYCGFCRSMRPCPCDKDSDFHASRRFLTRHDRGRTR